MSSTELARRIAFVAAEAADADPIECFRFSIGGTFYRYTSGDAPVTLSDGESYRVEAITREVIRASEEDGGGSVVVTLPADNPVAALCRSGLPTNPIWCSVLRAHRDATTLAVAFTGQVTHVEYEAGRARLTCSPLRKAITRTLPIQLTGRLCSNTLYDTRCGLDRDAFGKWATVTAVDGLTLTLGGAAGAGNPDGISNEADGYYSGGYVNFNNQFYAAIRTHTAPDTLVVLQNPGILVGDVVRVYAGCDKQHATCVEKFDNARQFQGFPWFPTYDPFRQRIG